MAAVAQRATRSRGRHHFAPPPASIVANALAHLHSEDLRIIASAAIDLLDLRAADCDLEDDDPSGDPLELLGEHPSDDATAILPTKPLYADDQSDGPINWREAELAYRADQLGVQRTAHGTWSFRS